MLKYLTVFAQCAFLMVFFSCQNLDETNEKVTANGYSVNYHHNNENKQFLKFSTGKFALREVIKDGKSFIKIDFGGSFTR